MLFHSRCIRRKGVYVIHYIFLSVGGLFEDDELSSNVFLKPACSAGWFSSIFFTTGLFDICVCV